MPTAVDAARDIARRTASYEMLLDRTVREVNAETDETDVDVIAEQVVKRMFEVIDEPIAKAVYEASDRVVLKYGTGGDPLTENEVQNVAAELLQSAGFDVDCPAVHLDYENEDPFAYGICSADGIHLRPELAHPIALAHELAHYVTPGDGHGRAFRSAAILLTKAAVSSPAAAMLDAEFLEDRQRKVSRCPVGTKPSASPTRPDLAAP